MGICLHDAAIDPDKISCYSSIGVPHGVDEGSMQLLAETTFVLPSHHRLHDTEQSDHDMQLA